MKEINFISVNDRPYLKSSELAELIGKNHESVLLCIKEVVGSMPPDFYEPLFIKIPYKESILEGKHTQYAISRKGVVLAHAYYEYIDDELTHEIFEELLFIFLKEELKQEKTVDELLKEFVGVLINRNLLRS